MTDAQRNQIDADAQIFIRTCSDAIKQVIIDGELHLFVIYMIWVYPLLFVKPSSASSSTLNFFYKQPRFCSSTQVAYEIGRFEYSSCLSVA